mmetsp:Transcript_125303/g.313061  ORF Transcript_125303/g.313061 Transcript_125303/m.313061 type:complete len:229 (+) Transcript_125303:528-1214(+)
MALASPRSSAWRYLPGLPPASAARRMACRLTKCRGASNKLVWRWPAAQQVWSQQPRQGLPMPQLWPPRLRGSPWRPARVKGSQLQPPVRPQLKAALASTTAQEVAQPVAGWGLPQDSASGLCSHPRWLAAVAEASPRDLPHCRPGGRASAARSCCTFSQGRLAPAALLWYSPLPSRGCSLVPWRPSSPPNVCTFCQCHRTSSCSPSERGEGQSSWRWAACHTPHWPRS